MFKTITLAKFVLFILISNDSESIEGDPIIIEYVFTIVTTNYILLNYMINSMLLNNNGFILNMVIISNIDTQHNIWYYRPPESNHVMSTNGKVSHLLIY